MDKPIRLIITADDYGVSPAINQGIRNGILKGVINTVTVLMNFNHAQNEEIDSQKALVKLLDFLKEHDKLKEVHVGVHLNITTGMPLVHNPHPDLTVAEPFYSFRELKKRNRIYEIDKLTLEKELRAQVDRFVDTITQWNKNNQIPEHSRVFLDHFTSQHNVLLTVPSFMNVVAKLCDEFRAAGKHPEFPIPVRRPIPLFIHKNRARDIADKVFRATRLYFARNWYKNLRYYFLFTKEKKLFRLVREGILGKNIPCPHAMYLGFFGKGANRNPHKKIITIRNNLGRLYKGSVKDGWLKIGDTMIVEIVHHPCAAGLPSEAYQLAEGVKALDYRMDYRKAESNTINYAEYKAIWKSHTTVKHGHHSDLNNPTFRSGQ